MMKRIGVAFLLLPIGITAVWLSGWYLVGVLIVGSLLIIHELMSILKKMELPSFSSVSYGFVAIIPVVLHLYGSIVLIPWLFLLLIVTGFLSTTGTVREGARGIIGTIFSCVMVAIPIASMLLIREAPVWPNHFIASYVLIYIWAGSWIGDSAAFFIGKRFGKTPLVHAISPKKTVEGAIGGITFTMLWAWFGAIPFSGLFATWDKILLGLLLSFLSIIGDLAESVLKREAGVKDSGILFPGHGGAYDRFDSMMLVSVGAWFYLFARGFIVL